MPDQRAELEQAKRESGMRGVPAVKTRSVGLASIPCQVLIRLAMQKFALNPNGAKASAALPVMRITAAQH